MTIALFIQREDSIRSRRRAPPGEPLLMFGEPGVLAKAEARGEVSVGLVLRRVLDKTGRWVSRWCRPAQGGDLWPELRPGSKAWLDKLNAEYGAAARPAADAAVLFLRQPKVNADDLKRTQGVIAAAVYSGKLSEIDRLYIINLGMAVFTRGQQYRLATPEFPSYLKEYIVRGLNMYGEGVRPTGRTPSFEFEGPSRLSMPAKSTARALEAVRPFSANRTKPGPVLNGASILKLARNPLEAGGLRTRVGTTEPNATGREAPTFALQRKILPGIGANVDAAIGEGHPSKLHRLEIQPLRRKNRRDALRGLGARPKDQSYDEYPPASSQEGGAGARVALVPRSEQNVQGGQLSAFYRKHKIKHGDPFHIKVVD
ncbi:MAG: NucA/NucB deoxyribonuclease domain-containing protein [Caulobacteraceae bacterium]